jgi:diguanylate cyclase (GGDEF)-like protein
MTEDKFDEIKQLKKNYFNLAELHREERDVLVRAINALSVLAPSGAGMEKDIRLLREQVSTDGDLSIQDIEDITRGIKDKLVNKRDIYAAEGIDDEMVRRLEDRLIESCRIVKRVMNSILDDFYPMTEDIKNAADNIKIDCTGDVTAINLKDPAEKLMNLIDLIKVKISKDMGDTNSVFFNLLGQVKELEQSLYTEFGGDTQIHEMETFEMSIGQQIGSIAESFTLYKTINEIRDAVGLKLKKITELVSFKKDEEVKRAQEAKNNISRLKKKVFDMEQKAQKISQKAKQFEKAAMRDGLTGLFSRGAFDLKMRDAIVECRGNKKSFALIMFDVDKFKSINDTLGHIAGDKVLKKVAECLEETFRKDDVIARYGGDEFVAFICDVSESMARDRIDDFNKNLKKRRFVSHKAGEINLTVSAGVATFAEGDTIDSVIERADTAMYAAKQKTA